MKLGGGRRDARPPTRTPHGQVLAEARDVDVILGGRRIVSGASLALAAGEVVALIGPNGAGKSTLLGAFAGDLGTSAGEMVVDGAPIGRWTSTELAMRRAVLPQTVTVSFPFTTREVVRMGRAAWARTPDEDLDDALIAGALAAADVSHLADRVYTSLSGGERARVALARVVAQRAQLLLLDEPTAALDVHHQELVLELARARAHDGDGVLVVLHDLAVAARHADRVVLLAGGRIVADGPPAVVFDAARLSRVYEHDIEVLPHPVTGELLVIPRGSELRPSCPTRESM